MKINAYTLVCECTYILTIIRTANQPDHIECKNPHCPNHGKRFKVPVVELEEVDPLEVTVEDGKVFQGCKEVQWVTLGFGSVCTEFRVLNGWHGVC